MSDILVVKVNMFCRSRELNDIRRYILSQIENGKVVVLPAYCDAQIVPDNIEIRVEDLSGAKETITMEILPPKYQKYRMFPQLQQNDENEQMQKALEFSGELLILQARLYPIPNFEYIWPDGLPLSKI